MEVLDRLEPNELMAIIVIFGFILFLLVLVNIGVLIRYNDRLENIEGFLEHFYNNVNNRLINQTDINENIIKKLEEQSDKIKNIPKEIAIKNILRIP